MRPVNEFKRVPQRMEIERIEANKKKDKIYIGSSIVLVLILAAVFGVMG